MATFPKGEIIMEKWNAWWDELDDSCLSVRLQKFLVKNTYGCCGVIVGYDGPLWAAIPAFRLEPSWINEMYYYG